MKLLHVIPPPQAIVRTKYVVTLTEEERADLTRLTTTGRTAARTILHAQVLLKADAAPSGPRWLDEDIRLAFGIGLTAIARIRRRFVEEGLEAALHRHPARTPRLWQKLEVHYTSKHGSWLNIAEIDLGVLAGQCLRRRIPDRPTLEHETTAWERDRNARARTFDWRFTTADARIKLKGLYPSL
jgi:hypothetical protein